MTVAGRYEILGPLGKGGMARVYRARDLVLRREVALKLLGSSAGDALALRFEREARAIARLDHAGCVRILDCGPRFITMELVAGMTLAQSIATGWFDEARAVRIARGILAALAHAHARGVLHRDVKPANVMLAGPRVVLIDFGLACLHDEAAVTAVGSCVGSPSYVAPERLLGRPCDARADVWAVGVILYEMVAGARPFPGTTPEQIMRHALHRPPRPLRAHRAGVSRALEALVQRALAKDPRRRFADAEEMLSALEDLPVPVPVPMPVPDPGTEPDPSSTVGLIISRPGLLRRMWSWLRYGRWRWSQLTR
jgi:serine/threonine-protein kinase